MYGLVGKNLKHSFSKEIHHLLGNKSYELFSTNSIKDFIKENHDLSGINVTIPHKTDIIPYLDDLDSVAKETYSVNTVINKNGKLIGYNTDYYGLDKLLKYNKIDIKNKRVVILGNGSVSKTVLKLINDKNAKSVIRLCRTVRSGNDFLFSEYKKFLHYDILINTTPVGMYPHNDDSLLIKIKDFHHLETVIDLVYNPLRSKLIIEAEKNKIKAVNGLYMLVMQAIKAHELFFNVEISSSIANKIYREIYLKHLNIVFVGLPLSGKSKYSKSISNLFSKDIFDTDQIIEKEANLSINSIFETYGEKYFRDLETKVIRKLYKLQNLVISTGGGMIENSKNMDLLKQNGIIFFLNKDPNKIAKKTIYNRPLLKQPENILVLSGRRFPLYKKHSDFIININFDTKTHINEIKGYINEYINS